MLNLELLLKKLNATELVASAPVKHLNFNQAEWMNGWKNGSRGKTLTSSSDCPSPPAALPPRTWSHACEEGSLSCWSHTHTPTYQSRETHHGVRGKGCYNLTKVRINKHYTTWDLFQHFFPKIWLDFSKLMISKRIFSPIQIFISARFQLCIGYLFFLNVLKNIIFNEWLNFWVIGRNCHFSPPKSWHEKKRSHFR